MLLTKYEGQGGQVPGVWTFIRARLLSLVITLAMTLLIMISILFSAIVQEIVTFGGSFCPGTSILLEVVNVLSLFAMSTVLFATIYKCCQAQVSNGKTFGSGRQ